MKFVYVGIKVVACNAGACSRWDEATSNESFIGKGVEPISHDDARVYAVDAGLSRDRLARAEFDLIGL